MLFIRPQKEYKKEQTSLYYLENETTKDRTYQLTSLLDTRVDHRHLILCNFELVETGKFNSRESERTMMPYILYNQQTSIPKRKLLHQLINNEATILWNFNLIKIFLTF